MTESLPAAPAGLSRLPLAGLGNALTALLVLFAALVVAGLVLPSRPLDLAAGADDLTNVVAAVTAIVFLVWFRRARLDAEDSGWRQRRSRNATLWGWIVPIWNLWIPFQLMGDIWRASLPEPEREQTAWLPGLWWTCCLAGTSLVGPAPRSGTWTVHLLSNSGPVRLSGVAVAGLLLLFVIRQISARLPAQVDRDRGRLSANR
jgi:hypothetical protein